MNIGDDTITAIATPPVSGPIGIVRASGKDAVSILAKIFKPKNQIDIKNAASHTIHYGYIMEDTKNGRLPVDEVLVTIMRAPHTYTTEDIVEVNCHGNPFVLTKVVDCMIKAGAKPAEPGEFTKRAFLNGRIDLIQAEAVADVINSKSEAGIANAYKHIYGDLSSSIKAMQDVIRKILVHIEAGINFPDESIDVLDRNSLRNSLAGLIRDTDKIISSCNYGRIMKEGVKTVIAGRTNAGKSSLFNLLACPMRKVVVTSVPGTTRDVISEDVLIEGRLFKIMDTAGAKTPKGIIEKECLKLSGRSIEEADIVVFMLDGSKKLAEEELNLWKIVSKIPHIIVINKIDLPRKIGFNDISNIFHIKRCIEISCKTQKGISALKKCIVALSEKLCRTDKNLDIILTNMRHKNVLEEAKKEVQEALEAVDKNVSEEFISANLTYALEKLQEITGEKVSEDVLNEIFSRFCIGK